MKNKTRQALRSAIRAIAAYPYPDSIRAAAHKRWANAMRQFLRGYVVEPYIIAHEIIYDLEFHNHLLKTWENEDE